jgi:hypothetical protein
VTDKQLDVGDLDAVVLRELTALRSFAPSRAFAGNVMARVRLPQPAAVVLLKRAGAWVVQPRRAVALATAYAASVAIALRLALPWLADHAPALRLAATWAANQTGALFSSIALTAGEWVVRSGATDVVRSALASGPKLWGALAALSIGYTVCGYGLHTLLKAPRRDDALARA